MKIKLKDKAIYLRRKGLSYSDILRQVHVARSTLSVWLRSVGMSKKQKQRLTLKKLTSMRKGWEKLKTRRIEKTMRITEQALSDIKNIKFDSNINLLIGVVLYWAEGAKEKSYRPGQGVIFSNSDPKMVHLFVNWLIDSIRIDKNKIHFDIYIHHKHIKRIKEIKRFWAINTGFNEDKFDKIYFKRHTVTQRRNTKASYFGLLRVKVRKSSDLNRKIAGWIKGICNKCGVV